MTIHTSTSSYIVWELINEVDRQLTEMAEGEDNSAKVASVVILVMAALESFLNSYFYDLAFVLKDTNFLETVKGNKGHVSTKNKILTWPERVKGKSISIDSPEYKAFDEVRILRDKLVHYKPDEICMGLKQLQFMPDHNISFYRTLTKDKGIKSLQAILDLIATFGGATETEKMMFLGRWTGRTSSKEWHDLALYELRRKNKRQT